MRSVILVPVFNDYAAFGILVRELALALRDAPGTVEILVVDDGSDDAATAPWNTPSGAAVPLQVLRLRHNVGHQRAIAIGLAHIVVHRPCDAVVVMDGDGEDRPEDVPRLLHALQLREQSDVVFAERTRRSERWLFRRGYDAYRLLHWLATGIRVKFGNFSAIRHRALERLVNAPELWTHYAAAVVRIGLPYTTIRTSRGSRYRGQSRLSLQRLVVHGLSALSIFGPLIALRLAVLSLAAGLWSPGAAVAGLAMAAGIRFLPVGHRAHIAFNPLRAHQEYVRDVISWT